jgi:hypothetical protein
MERKESFGGVVIVKAALEAFCRGLKYNLLWCGSTGGDKEACIVDIRKSWKVMTEDLDDPGWVTGCCSPRGKGLGVDGCEFMVFVQVSVLD